MYVAQAFISKLRSMNTRLVDLPVYEQPVAAAIPGKQQNLFDTQFDEQGRQTSAGTARYRYDSLSRLTGIDRAAGEATSSTDGAAGKDATDGKDIGTSKEIGAPKEIARYRYNLFGQRIAKTVVLADGKSKKTTHYFYDGSQLVFEGDNATDSTAKQYLWINDKPISLLYQDHLFAIHVDHRNAPLALTDESRKVVWQARVADFLQATPAQGTTLGEINFNLRGSNQYFDAESGLHYNTNRYYDPIAARYLTPDPKGLAVGPDLYAFAMNRPHEMADPLGLEPVATDWRKATYEQRLTEIINRAVPLVPGEIGSALQEMVKPENLVIMGTIFTIWMAAQATPAGWVADLAILALSYYAIGQGIVDLFQGMMALHQGAQFASCDEDLNRVAKVVAQKFIAAIGGVIGGAGGAGAINKSGKIKRIAEGIKEVIAYGKKRFKVPKKPSMPSGADSIVNALKLRTQLAFQEAGILDADLKLTPKAIAESTKSSWLTK